MDAFTNLLIDLIAREDNPFGLVLLALSAAIEYVFPPFPGDTITLFGAVLITAYSWSFWGVFGTVMVGAVAGSMLAFYLGGWLQGRRRQRVLDRQNGPAVLDRLVERFHRHGAVYLVINRFLPGVRALFFVAAGMAGMRPLAVMAYSAISAAVWNLAIIAAGSALGANFDTLSLWVSRYTTLVWIIVGIAVVFLLIRWLWTRRERN